MASPSTFESPKQSSQSSPDHLTDSLSKALRPIAYTPEDCRKPVESLCTKTVVKQALHTARLPETSSSSAPIQEPLKQDSLKDITDCMNSTVTLFESNPDSTNHPSDVAGNKLESKSTNSSSVLQRYFVGGGSFFGLFPLLPFHL